MRTPCNPRPLPPMILAIALAAVAVGACQAAAPPTSPPATSRPAPATSVPTAATRATPAALGTITLTDTGCSWAGNPGSVSAGMVTIQARNQTDDYADFSVHRLRTGHTWQDGEAAIAAIQAALRTGAEWPPEISDVVTEEAALAGLGKGIAFHASAGTYGVVCSASTGPTGEILTVFLVGPLVVST